MTHERRMKIKTLADAAWPMRWPDAVRAIEGACGPLTDGESSYAWALHWAPSESERSA
jgi:hypothetical protein